MFKRISFMLTARRRVGEIVNIQLVDGGMAMGVIITADIAHLQTRGADGDTAYMPLGSIAALGFGPAVARRFELLREETRLRTLDRERTVGERHGRMRDSIGESDASLKRPN